MLCWVMSKKKSFTTEGEKKKSELSTKGDFSPSSIPLHRRSSKMANPHEPHFFKPLLPGFHDGVTIPLSFFSHHIQGKTNGKKWKLRSDASDQTWEVIQEGRRLTGGWKDFTTAHDLQIGDVLVFKHEGDMVFHVTPFGPSCCEIQYTHPHSIKEEADVDDTHSFSFDYCFLAEVTASNINEDKLYLPVEATTCTALNKQCKEIIFVNKEGNSWTGSLRYSKADDMYYIRKGWRKFCEENRCTIGDLFVFNVVGDGNTTPLMCVCPERKECSELLIKHLSRMNGDIASSSRVI
ncbi:hypothetical protein YC2023_123958 [Brassica napus]